MKKINDFIIIIIIIISSQAPGANLSTRKKSSWSIKLSFLIEPVKEECEGDAELLAVKFPAYCQQLRSQTHALHQENRRLEQEMISVSLGTISK